MRKNLLKEMSMSLPKIYVINLAHSNERREFMTAQLAAVGIDAEFFAAVNGRNMSEVEIARVYDHAAAQGTDWGELNQGEIGCALSHRGVWQSLLDSGEAGAVVLEDDVRLDPDFLKVLRSLPAKTKDGDVVLFNTGPEQLYELDRQSLEGGRELVWVNQAMYRACGYYMTPLAARRLLKKSMPIWFPIDFWYSRPGFRGVTPIKLVRPPIVEPREQDECPSEIGGRERQLQSVPRRVRKGLRAKWRSLRLKLKNGYLCPPEKR